jgi:hypothetical protein
MSESEDRIFNELNRIARELVLIRTEVIKVINYIADAESEVPEKMRRFMNYMHDVHDVTYLYEEHGQQVPPHLARELERLDDRYRQMLKEMNLEGGTFNKIRRQMASDPENRYDHTKQLPKPKEKESETR